MALVVESTTTANTSGISITITKPTGLQVDELLVCVASSSLLGTPETIDVASGWSNATIATADNTTDTATSVRVQYKIADSADVAASNFTFSSTYTSLKAGVLLRVSGIRTTGTLGVVDADVYNSTATTAISFTSTITPAQNGSLIIMGFSAARVGAAGAGSIGSYTSTPTNTWTEILDYGVDSSSTDPITGVAYTIQSTAAQLTNYSATLSLSRTLHAGVLATFYPVVDATGTNVLHSVSPSFFSQAGRGDTNGTNALLEVAPTHFDQAGRATTPIQWSNEAKPSTSWTNET